MIADIRMTVGSVAAPPAFAFMDIVYLV